MNNDVIFWWHFNFNPGNWAEADKYVIPMLRSLDNSDVLIRLYRDKNNWK